VSPAVVRRCHFPGSPVAARVVPGRAALGFLSPSRAFAEVLIAVIVIGWTAPGPAILRVYAHLASVRSFGREFDADESYVGGTVSATVARNLTAFSPVPRN
jgi:hypothetical protein